MLLLSIALLTTGTSVFGKDPAWSSYFHRIATGYHLEVPEGGGRTQLQLHPTPIAKWSQPVRGGDDGALYLWLRDKRPMAIGAFFIWPSGERFGVSHEWISLSEGRIVGKYDSRIWNCPAGGVTWKPLKESLRTNTATKQKLEMRSIARRFQAESLNRENNRVTLRLISQPVYVYPLNEDGSKIGGVFRIAHGTDTEILLLLEPRSWKGKTHWHYALARLSDLQLTVQHNGQEVWFADFHAFEEADAHYFGGLHEFLTAPPASAPETKRR